jgi:hypothetical protein
MIRGEALSDKLEMSPVAAMWAPNMIVGAGGLWLLWRVVRERYAPGVPAWKRLVAPFGRLIKRGRLFTQRGSRSARAQDVDGTP